MGIAMRTNIDVDSSTSYPHPRALFRDDFGQQLDVGVFRPLALEIGFCLPDLPPFEDSPFVIGGRDIFSTPRGRARSAMRDIWRGSSFTPLIKGILNHGSHSLWSVPYPLESIPYEITDEQIAFSGRIVGISHIHAVILSLGILVQ